MRHFIKLAVAFALTAVVAGCSGAEGSDASADSEEITGDAEGALTARVHYAPAEAALEWEPGCGMRRPDDQGACYVGLKLWFNRTYRDLGVAIRTSVNNTTDTITVKLDTWSTSSVHPIMFPSPDARTLGIPKRLSIGKTYQAKVVDYQGNVVWTGEIRPMFAP